MAPLPSSSPFPFQFTKSTNKIENLSDFVHRGVKKVSNVFEDGVNIVTAPVKWINHIQENWLKYTLYATAIPICFLIFYCFVRQRPTTLFFNIGTNGINGNHAINKTNGIQKFRNMVPNEDKIAREFMPPSKTNE